MELALFTKKNRLTKHEMQFEVHSIESLNHNSEGNNFSIFYGGFSIVWLLNGSGSINLDAEVHSVEANMVYYTKPGKTLLLKLDEESIGFIIHYGPEFLHLNERHTSKLINSLSGTHFSTINSIRINSSSTLLLRGIVTNMLIEFKNLYALRAEVLKKLLILFILQLRRKTGIRANVPVRSRKSDIVDAFYTLLENHITTKKMVKDYAESLSVTPNYLNDTVKELSGFSASFHIKQRIVLEAKRRAVFEGDSLKEIAYHFGFWDPAHFSKYFKNGSGMNFTDFKKGISDFC